MDNHSAPPGSTADRGTLHLVSTPIGNLGDITLRALDILRSVDLIVAEDTRQSRKLLDRYEIRTPMVAGHEHNEASLAPRIVQRLAGGESVALITDAGTPLLSDPGRRLVDAAIAAGHPVSPVPGPSALLAALVASGLECTRFIYLGFLARKGQERATELELVAASLVTSVIYESPARLGATLTELAEVAGPDRPAAVARELTKLHEEIRRGTLAELTAYYTEHPARGEIVIVVGPRTARPVDEESLRESAAGMLAAGHTPREIQAALVTMGAPRNLAYRLAHQPARPSSRQAEQEP